MPFLCTHPEDLTMPIFETYIPKEYLALKINYCKQQLAGLPEVTMTQRNVKGIKRTVFVVNNHIYSPDSKTGQQLSFCFQQRETYQSNLSVYEGFWISAFRGSPPSDIKPRDIVRCYLNNNNESIVMDRVFFDSLKNDANPYHPESKTHYYNGTYYRSQHEVDIARYYTEHKIPFKYEPEIWIKGLNYPIYPDFVILIEELNLCKFHEHFGMNNFSNYARKTLTKYSNYSEAGLIMDLDVICTYSFEQIPFDLRMLSTKLNHAVFTSLFAAPLFQS